MLFFVLTAVGITVYIRNNDVGPRSGRVMEFIQHPADHPDWVIQAGTQCKNSVFLFPTTGFIGYLWQDSFKVGHRHQGIDIFGGTEVGITPVIAAHNGFLPRLPEWKSTVAIRIPMDPLWPNRTIWLYYTHLADANGKSTIAPEFPPGTAELPVTAGTVLGTQGNFSGEEGNPVGVHLHFSIVKDDGEGKPMNELDPANTYDPSPYFNMELDAGKVADDTIPRCEN